MALVFPGFMMMQMLSAGAMGGGISSAIARALGGGRRDDADALVLHALIINGLLGLVLLGGVPAARAAALPRAWAAKAGSLEAALQLFRRRVRRQRPGLADERAGQRRSAAPATCWCRRLAVCVGVALLVPLSPLLIFGFGPIPAMGIAGGGVAVVLTTALTAAVLAWYVLSGRSLVRPRLARLRWRCSATSCGSAPSARSAPCRPRSPWR